MKLKFINLLLAAFLLIGSAQALTSCKDTDEDLYAQLRDENATLKSSLEKEIEVLRGQISALEGVTGALQNQINDLKAQLADYVKRAELENYVKKSEFNDLVDKYIAAVSEYNNLKAVLDDLKSIHNDITNLQGDYTNLANQYVALEGRLTVLEQTLAKYDFDAMVAQINANKNDIAVLNQFKAEWEGKLGTIEANAANALAIANQNKADIQALNTTINTLKTDLNTKIDAVGDRVTTLEGQVATILADYVTSGQMTQAIADAIAPLATKEALEEVANQLRAEAAANLAEVEQRLQEQIVTCVNRLNGLDTKVADLQSAVADLQSDMTEAKDNIAANTAAISGIQTSLNKVIVRLTSLENRVSSITLQGTTNPVFGYLATPLGISSNMLMNYAGENVTGIEVAMPNYLDDGVEYNGELVITAADMAILNEAGIKGAETWEPMAKLMSKEDGNLGTLYLTVNPANINMVGKDFAIVNSKNEVMPVELKNLRPSTAELTMGYTRSEADAQSANGFYEADVTVDPNDINIIKVTIDKSLKNAAKQLLADKSPKSVLALGNALYNQFNGILPALGVRAAWEEETAEGTINQTVTSQYGIAATVFQPLSYKFLYGVGPVGHIKLPDIPAIANNIKLDLTAAGLNLTFDPSQFQVEGLPNPINLNLGIQLTNLGTSTISVDIPVFNAYGQVEGYHTVGNIDIDFNQDLLTQLNIQLRNEFDNINEGANAMLNAAFAALVNQINAQITGLLDSMSTEVNSSLNDVLANLQNQVNGKIDSFANVLLGNQLYQSLQGVVDRLNAFLEDPNHFLQATLLYNNSGNYGMFSSTPAMPTVFKGGQAVMLTPTTFTGETVTPAFKKFVAVTNVFKTSDNSVSAQAGDATCKALAKAANQQEFMNEVISGERRTIPFFYNGGEGYTYEIVYQALDYSGYTSTQKFYVSIK